MEKIFLTGTPGVGKSTIIERLQRKFATKIVGVISREIRDEQGIRQGFTSCTFDSSRSLVIAHVGIDSELKVGRYGVDLPTLDIVAGLLEDQWKEALGSNRVLVFDEVGLMQSFSDQLKLQIEKILDSDCPTIMTIKQDDNESDWLKNIKTKQNVRVFTLTEDNRETILNLLTQYVQQNS